jgi:hypothetical protein
MSTALLSELEARIAEMESNLASLKRAREILTGIAPSATETAVSVPRSNVIRLRKRAPGGFLEDQIVRALGGATMSREDIRAKLISGSYPYSLEETHVSKALSRLVGAKTLKGIGPRSQRRYQAA